MAEAGGVADQGPAELAVGHVAEPPVVVAGVVEQYVGLAVAGEVTDPEGPPVIDAVSRAMVAVVLGWGHHLGVLVGEGNSLVLGRAPGPGEVFDSELVERMTCRPWLDVLVHPGVCALRAVGRRGCKPLRMTGLSLPAGEEPVDVGVQEEHKRVAEGDVLVAQVHEAVHGVVNLLQLVSHDGVVAGRQDCVVLVLRGRGPGDRAADEAGRVRGIVGCVAVRHGPRGVEAGTDPGRTNGATELSAPPHEPWREQVQRPGGPVAEVRIRDRSRVLCPVPVVQGDLGMNLAEQLLEPVDDHPMPWKKLRASVHVCRLVDLVLLEPPGHTPRYLVGAGSRVPTGVQLDHRVQQQGSLGWIDRGDISSDAVT